jgi:uncharacterized protein with FMN-binding domain
MRRIVLALFGTILGTTLLVGLKTQVAGHPLGVAVAAPVDPGVESATPTGSIPASGPPSGQPSTVAGAPTTGPAAPAGGQPSGPAPTGTTKAPAPPAKTTSAPPASRSILGPAVATVWNGNNYGTMQVKIAVTGTHIDDIVTVQQSNRPKTVSTTLRSQALTAQSANVGNVSGATASSNAYKQSLQGAIAKI